MLALNGHVVVSLFRDVVRVVVDVRLFEVHGTVFEPKDAYVLDLRVTRKVVLFHTGIYTPPASYASLYVQTV